MNTEIIGVIVMFAGTVLLAIPLGRYIAKVYEGQKTWLDPILTPIDKYFSKRRYSSGKGNELEAAPVCLAYHQSGLGSFLHVRV